MVVTPPLGRAIIACVLAGLLIWPVGVAAGSARGGLEAGETGPLAARSGTRPEQQADNWARLGPPGPQQIRALAVRPDWPQNPVLLAFRHPSGPMTRDLFDPPPPYEFPGHLVRSTDGGRSWERLPAPAERMAWIRFTRSPLGVALAFALDGPEPPLSVGNRALYRSADGGRSWESLFRVATSRHMPELLLSPAFERDGVAFFVAGDALYRSTDTGVSWVQVMALGGSGGELALSPAFSDDRTALLVSDARLFLSREGGASWSPVDLFPDQQVIQALLSPAFGSDRTIVAALASGGHPTLRGRDPRGGDWDAGEATMDHLLSVGVIVSTDGGESWSEISVGMEIDGVPFRHVQRIAISPTFADDGTLFAFAWGPREPGLMDTSDRTVRSALFRSRDRGVSWDPVHTFGRHRVRFALSPRFSEDGVAILQANSDGPSPASISWRTWRTADWGARWDGLPGPRSLGNYGGAFALQLFGAGGKLVGSFRTSTSGGVETHWRISRDRGQSWEELRTPDGAAVSSVALSPAIDQDHTVFVGAAFGGVWMLGPGVQSTEGLLPCTWPPAGAFGLGSEPSVRAPLGCPVEPERQVTLHERLVDQTRPQPHEVWTYRARAESRVHWTEDDSEWFELSPLTVSPRGDPNAGWRVHRKDGPLPLPEGPERVLEGMVQRFDGGRMLLLLPPDGPPTILVLSRPNIRWYELQP